MPNLRKGRVIAISLQIFVFIVLGLEIYVQFETPELDEALISHFYQPENQDAPWYLNDTALVTVFYQLAPIITASTAIGIFGILIGSFFTSRLANLRSLAVFVLIVMVTGPGILVNAVFKDHWERPRPRETVEFGGQYEYQAPWIKGNESNGKSFPCGHCSVGFAMCAIAFWFRRRSIALFWAINGAAITLGMVFGYARMAAGAHYFSDVLASGLITFFVAWALSTLFPRFITPSQSTTENTPRKINKGVAIGLGTAAAALLIGSLLAFPYQTQHRHVIPYPNEALTPLILEIDQNIQWQLTEEIPDYILINGNSRGFGLPWSSVILETEIIQRDAGKVLSIIQNKGGYFTEIRTQIEISAKTQ